MVGANKVWSVIYIDKSYIIVKYICIYSTRTCWMLLNSSLNNCFMNGHWNEQRLPAVLSLYCTKYIRLHTRVRYWPAFCDVCFWTYPLFYIYNGNRICPWITPYVCKKRKKCSPIELRCKNIQWKNNALYIG